VVEHKAVIKGIKMSKGVELISAISEETIVLPKVRPTIIEGVLVAIKVRYSEPKFNLHSGSILKGVPRDWSRGIHSVSKVPRPNPPCCTYCH
jgi:hypothetical protein